MWFVKTGTMAEESTNHGENVELLRDPSCFLSFVSGKKLFTHEATKSTKVHKETVRENNQPWRGVQFGVEYPPGIPH